MSRELEEGWKAWSEAQEQEERQSQLPSLSQLEKESGNKALKKLQTQVLAKLIYTVFFALCYAALALYTPSLVVKALFALLILAHIIFLPFAWRQWRELKKPLPMDISSKAALTKLIERMEWALRTEEQFALLVYPIAASAGFFFALSQQVSWEKIMQTPFYWYVLLGAIVILTPLCYWLAKWLNKLAFGRYLNGLKKLLDQFESEEEETKGD